MVSPRISVVTASFNAARTIADCVRSVQAQSWPEVEHLFVDGGSRDDTVAVIRRTASAGARLVSEPDRGIYDALNKGIASATGDVIGLLHADDMFADDRVLHDIATAFVDPRVDAVYGDLEYVRRDDPTRVVRHWRAGAFQQAELARGWMPPHPTLYIRRRVLDDVGAFDLRYRIASDYDFMLRLFRRPELVVVYVPRVLVRMRRGGVSNRSLRSVLRKSREDWTILRRHGYGVLGTSVTLAGKNLGKAHQLIVREGKREP